MTMDRKKEKVTSAENEQGAPMWTRRKFLKKASASILVLSVGGLLWRSIDQGVFSPGKGPAYELWAVDDSPPLAGPLSLVHSAILASNPHNSQPWLFRVNDSSIELLADEKRHIGSMDPLRREMQIGLGCALENMILAAEAKGYIPHLNYYPDPSNPDFVARVELQSGKTKSSDLYEAIPNRHTHRGSYDTGRSVSPQLMHEIEELCMDEKNVKLTWLTTSEQKKLTGDLTLSATEAIIADAQMSHDSNRWYRDNWKDLQEYRDGITLDAQGGPLWIRTLGKILPPISSEKADQFWLNSTRQTHVNTAAGYGLLSVRDSSNKEERVRAGRVWQRIHLKGTLSGLAMHPLNQPVEMKDRELQLGMTPSFGQRLQQLMSESGWEVVFLFRFGYPLGEALPSPRRALEDVVI